MSISILAKLLSNCQRLMPEFVLYQEQAEKCFRLLYTLANNMVEA